MNYSEIKLEMNCTCKYINMSQISNSCPFTSYFFLQTHINGLTPPPLFTLPPRVFTVVHLWFSILIRLQIDIKIVGFGHKLITTGLTFMKRDGERRERCRRRESKFSCSLFHLLEKFQYTTVFTMFPHILPRLFIGAHKVVMRWKRFTIRISLSIMSCVYPRTERVWRMPAKCMGWTFSRKQVYVKRCFKIWWFNRCLMWPL